MLNRKGISIKGIIVVSPFGAKRIKYLARQRGKKALLNSFNRLYKSEFKRENDPLKLFLKSNNIEYSSITDWCRKNQVPRLSVKSLNDNFTVSFIRNNPADWVIYGGGGILKEPFINAANGKVLNAHSGPLPEIRGMNACEWSILLGYEPSVTIHLINRGIDTGGIIRKSRVTILAGDDIETLRGKCVVEGIKGIVETVVKPPLILPEPDLRSNSFRQCFVLAPAMKELLESRLSVFI